MALRKSSIAIPFAGGVDTRTDPKQVAPTKLVDLTNAVFTRVSTISKRNGYRSLGQSVLGAASNYAGAIGLAARADELLLFTDRKAYSYRTVADEWSDAGDVASVIASETPIARTGTQQRVPEVASRNGVTAVAWEDSRGGVRLSVIETDSGRILLADTSLDSSATAVHPRCVQCGEVIHVLWARPDISEIKIATVNPASPSVAPSVGTLTADLRSDAPVFDAEATYGAFDAAGISDRPAVIAWSESGAGFRVGYIAPSGALGSPVTGYPSVFSDAKPCTGCIAVAVYKVGGQAIGVIVAGPGIVQPQAKVLSPSNLSTIRGPVGMGPGNVKDGVRIALGFGGKSALDDRATAYWALEHDADEAGAGDSSLNEIEVGKFAQTNSGDDAQSSTLRGHCLVTRAFHDGPRTTTADAPEDIDGDVYVCVARPVRFFPYVATVRLSAAAIGGSDTCAVARLLPGISAGDHVRPDPDVIFPDSYVRHVSSVEDRIDNGSVSGRIHYLPLSYRIQLSSSSGDQFGETGIKLVTLDFDNIGSYQTAELGRNLYLAGALPQSYDADRYVEADYHTAPDWGHDRNLVSISPAASFTAQVGTGSMGAGTYQYKLWYEDVDAQGELHPGPVSIGVNVTVGGGGTNEVFIAIPTYRLTRKRNVRIGVARSRANATGDPEAIEFFRVTSIDPSAVTGNNRYRANDPNSDTVSVVDGLSDSVLATKEPLYTNGGILSNDPAPWAGGAIVSCKSRLFWTDPGDPHLVRYSQQIRDETGVEAPVDLSLRVDPFGGRIVALASLDDTVIVLCETAIYVFGGPGPDADGGLSGSQAAFSPAELVTADVGCSSPHSVAQMPLGIMFQSSKGIVLLTRARQVQHIGEPVTAYDAQTVTNATLIPDRQHVLFLTDSGRTLLYDYHVEQWSTFTNHEGFDAVVVDGTYHYLRTDGRVFRETPGVYVDATLRIPMLIETAWIKMGGYLQGFQKILRAMLVGTFKSNHTLRVRYKIDYGEMWRALPDVDATADYVTSPYGTGPYGAGDYGGPLSQDYGTVYQQQYHINRRCQSIAFRIEDYEGTAPYGASFEISELLLTGGMLGPAFFPGAARSQ